MIAGFLIIGFLADHLRKSAVSTMGIAIIGMTVFIITQVFLLFQPTQYATIGWVAFGFFSTSAILVYAALSQRFPAELAGRVNTAYNFLTFVLGFLLQWGIGAIINAFASEIPGQYASTGYQQAFLLLVVIQLLSLFWYAVYRVK